MALLNSTLVPIGSPAINFCLPGTDEKEYCLGSFSGKEVLVLIFTCNHCPYAKALEGRLIEFQKKYFTKNVQIIAINANDDSTYPDDSFEEMKKKNYPFPYLRDETQEIARVYQAQCTPDIYVYDQERRLSYHGRFDNNWQDEAGVTTYDLEDAVQAILKKENPPEPQYPSMGCSIKWKE